jgi:hypothetical protein
MDRHKSITAIIPAKSKGPNAGTYPRCVEARNGWRNVVLYTREVNLMAFRQWKMATRERGGQNQQGGESGL